MASTPPQYTNGLTLILPNHDQEHPFSTPIFRPADHRTPSFSSESSLSSDEDSYPPYSPTTRIPFSWEQIPGIPKHKESKKKEYSEHLLPPPPAGNSNSTATKKSHHHSNTKFVRSLQRDPFFAALVECSKDDHNHIHDHNHGTNMVSSKITRTLSDRFGLINLLYSASCKTTCSVSEPIRSSPHYLFHNRRL